MTVEGTVDEVRAALATRLRAALGNQLSEQAAISVAEAVLDEHLHLDPERDRLVERGILERRVIYAIHDSDLKLIDESVALAVAAWSITGNPGAVLAKLVPFLYRLRRNRVRLEGDVALTLLALKDGPRSGSTIVEVRDRLEQAYGRALTEEQVQATLSALKEVAHSDNKRSAFANVFEGRWFPVDV